MFRCFGGFLKVINFSFFFLRPLERLNNQTSKCLTTYLTTYFYYSASQRRLLGDSQLVVKTVNESKQTGARGGFHRTALGSTSAPTPTASPPPSRKKPQPGPSSIQNGIKSRCLIRGGPKGHLSRGRGPSFPPDSERPLCMLMGDNSHKGWKLLPGNPGPRAALFAFPPSAGFFNISAGSKPKAVRSFWGGNERRFHKFTSVPARLPLVVVVVGFRARASFYVIAPLRSDAAHL